MNRLVKRQIRWNAESRSNWERACTHREKVTRLIVDAVSSRVARLCVLGAGNCNDLDLTLLSERFAEVHLADLDSAALGSAVSRQGVADLPSIRLHGNCDVSGVLEQLSSWSPDRWPSRPELARVMQAAETFPGPEVPGPFDAVASVCLLSQLTEAIASSLGENHPQFLDLVRLVRQRHLRLLVELAAPGGFGALVTDVVSSETAPELPAVSDDRLPAVLSGMINARNFFHGLNPAVLERLLRDDPTIGPFVESVRCLRPWRWDFGVRHYAVVAFTFRRK